MCVVFQGGPHPGMRAAAEMKKQMAPQGGNSGRGMMGIVLPMYAVGIVVYLIYTLSKVPKDYIHYVFKYYVRVIFKVCSLACQSLPSTHSAGYVHRSLMSESQYNCGRLILVFLFPEL